MVNERAILQLLFWRECQSQKIKNISQEFRERALEEFENQIRPTQTILIVCASVAILVIVIGLLITVVTAPVTPAN